MLSETLTLQICVVTFFFFNMGCFLLIHSPSACRDSDWTSLKPEVGNSVPFYHMKVRDTTT